MARDHQGLVVPGPCPGPCDPATKGRGGIPRPLGPHSMMAPERLTVAAICQLMVFHGVLAEEPPTVPLDGHLGAIRDVAEGDPLVIPHSPREVPALELHVIRPEELPRPVASTRAVPCRNMGQ